MVKSNRTEKLLLYANGHIRGVFDSSGNNFFKWGKMFKTMVVEDNAGFRESLITLLGGHFSTMVFEKASSSEEALEKLGWFSPQLIFVDISLPGQNGLELSKTLRIRYKNAVIVILTNSDGPEYRQAANQCGANYFLSKGGSSMDEIIRVVESAVNRTMFTH